MVVTDINQALREARLCTVVGVPLRAEAVYALLTYIGVLEASVSLLDPEDLVAHFETLDILNDPSTMDAINEALNEKEDN